MMKSILALSFAFACVSCGSEGGVANPAPRSAPTDAATDPIEDVDTPSTPASDASPDGSKEVRRTVVQRNPFGNFAETENLLFDGDFEWSGGWSSQYPWFVWPAGELTIPPLAFGADCRSGLRCVRVSPGSAVAGIGVKPPGGASAVSIEMWSRPLNGSLCPHVEVTLEGCFDTTESHALAASSSTPGDDGWCRIAGIVPVFDADEAPCLFVSMPGPEFIGGITIDDVVMKAAPAGTQRSKAAPPTETHRRLVANLRKIAQGFRHPHRSPLPPALRRKTR